MKKKGTPSEITEKRDGELMRLYRQAKSMIFADKQNDYTVFDVYKLMATLPAEGYHVSEDSAWRYIEARRKGETPSLKSEYKRKLYEKLYDTVMVLRIRADYVNCSTRGLMYRAMTFRAPCIGLSPAAIRREIERLTRNKKHKHDRRSKQPKTVQGNPGNNHTDDAAATIQG